MRKNTSVRPADDIERIMELYGNMLFRLSLITLGNKDDAEDAVQETMMKCLQKNPVFESKEHEKAWLIRVCSNKCKDILRYRNRHQMADIEETEGIEKFYATESDSSVMEALMKVPEKFRIVLFLYYAEEYKIHEIAGMIGKSKSAVKMRLQKGRKLLEEIYRKEYM